MATKLPPQNLQAEQSIIGGLMIEPQAWDEISDIIVATDFYKPAHEKLYETIAELHKKNQPIDIITVTNSLTSSGQLDSIGGADYLIQILNSTVSSAHIVSYAKIVKEKALLRKIINTSQSIIQRSFDEDFQTVDSFLDSVEGEIFKINETTTAGGLVGAAEIVKSTFIKIEERFNNKQDITGLATGFRDLDSMTAGLHPGELIIVAARPSMGKTAFSLNLAQNMVLNNKKSLAYFSLEMGKDQLMERMIASESKISAQDIRKGRISNEHWPRLISAAGALSDAKIFIDDSPGISPFEIRARARRLKAKHDLDIIMIDYLQLMSLKSKVESREREVSEISKTLKAIAKELQIPVIALAQLNRGVESRSDRRPMLSDLRESGSIEQDADVIMMLYRDDYYEKENPDMQGRAEVIIGKQRNGPTGTVHLKFESRFGRFKDADPEAQNNNYQQQQQQMQASTQKIATPPSGAGPNGRPKNFAPGALK